MPDLKVKVSADSGPFEAGMRRVENVASNVAGHVKSRLSSLIAPLSGIGAAVSAAFAGHAIVEGVKDVFNLGGALAELSDQTGISVKNLVILRKNFSDAGLEADDLGKAVVKMQKFLEDAMTDEKKVNLIQELGLSFADLRKMKPEEQLYTIGRALSGISDAAERNAKALDLFGKSGSKLNIVFQDSAFGVASEKLRARAEMLERNAKLFDEISDRLGGPSGVLKTFYAGIADAVGPKVLALLKEIGKIDLTSAGKTFGTFLVGVFDKVLQISANILSLPWMDIFKGVGSVFLGMWEDVKSIVDYVSGKVKNLLNPFSQTEVKMSPMKTPGALRGLAGLFASPQGPQGEEPERVTVEERRIQAAYATPAMSMSERRAMLLRDARYRRPTATNAELNAEADRGMEAYRKRQEEEKLRAQMTGQKAGEAWKDAFDPSRRKYFFEGRGSDAFDRRFHPERFEKKPEIGAGGDKAPETRSYLQQLIDAIKTVGATVSESNKTLVAQ